MIFIIIVLWFYKYTLIKPILKKYLKLDFNLWIRCTTQIWKDEIEADKIIESCFQIW